MRNPAKLVTPPQPDEKPDYEIFEVVEVQPFLNFVNSMRHRDYPAILVALHSGMRRGEFLGLKWSNVDLEKGEVWVVQTLLRYKPHKGFSEDNPCWGKPKTIRSKRPIPLTLEALDILNKIKREQAKNRLQFGAAYHIEFDLVFCEEDGSPVNPSAFSKRYKKLVSDFGKQQNRLNDTRHTYASIMHDSGANDKALQELLGHTVIATTYDTCTHMFKDSKKKVVDNFENHLRKASGK